jgi:hypothetical protein
MIQKSFIFLLILLGVSCSKTDDGTQGIVNLKNGDCFRKFENRVSMCLDSVFNDSRCPTGFVCIWEGDAVAAFSISRDDIVKKFNLHTNKSFQNDTVIDGITIKLLTIMPYPSSDSQFDTKDYRVEISVDEN